MARQRSSSVPALALSTEPVLLATLSGLGAAFFAGAAFVIVRWALVLIGVPPPSLTGIAQLLATAAGMAVALRAGGPRAAVLFATWIVIGKLIAIPALSVFCSRAGPDVSPECSAIGFLLSAWPRLAGLLIGILGARWLMAAGRGTNVMLHAAGLLTLAVFVSGLALQVAQPGGTIEDALLAEVVVLAISLSFAFAAGTVLARGPTDRRPVLLLCAALVLPALVQGLPLALNSVPAPGLQAVLPWMNVAIPALQCVVLIVTALRTSGRSTLPGRRSLRA